MVLRSVSIFLFAAVFVSFAQSRSERSQNLEEDPILDAKISFLLTERTGAETLDAILQEVAQATGVRIGVGSAPVGVLLNKRVIVGAADQTARDVLGQLLLALGSKEMPDGSTVSQFAYHLYRDAGQKQCMLNVHAIPLR